MYHEYITLHYINIKGIISTINTRISRYQVSLLCRNMVKINSIPGTTLSKMEIRKREMQLRAHYYDQDIIIILK